MAEDITRILVPVDFSTHSDHALQYAATLSSKIGASVELLHVVVDPFASGALTGETFVPVPEEALQALVKDAEKRLAMLKTEKFPHGSDVDTMAMVGLPAHTIVEHAEARGFDLIVMGTHGRTGFSHLFMGSVAERVVRTSPCPVLTVRGAVAAPRPETAPKAA